MLEKKMMPLWILLFLFSCRSNQNVIQGRVTYIDDSTNQELAAAGVNVFLYSSFIQWQDQRGSFDKVVVTATSGHYSLFPLPSGPYYIYSEKLDSSGKIIGTAGTSISVRGHETKVLDLFLH